MKVPSEKILKPGVKLEVKKIDFNDPEVKAIIKAHHAELDKLKRIRVRRYKNLTTTI